MGGGFGGKTEHVWKRQGSGMPWSIQQQLCGGYFEVDKFMLLPYWAGIETTAGRLNRI
jgi:hypothetical protein